MPWQNAVPVLGGEQPRGPEPAAERRISATLQTTRCGLPQSPSRNPRSTNHSSFLLPLRNAGQGAREADLAASPPQNGGRFKPHADTNNATRMTGTCAQQACPHTPQHTQPAFHGAIPLRRPPHSSECTARWPVRSMDGGSFVLCLERAGPAQAGGRRSSRLPAVALTAPRRPDVAAFSVEPGCWQLEDADQLPPKTCSNLTVCAHTRVLRCTYVIPRLIRTHI